MGEHPTPIGSRFASFIVASILLGVAYFFLLHSVDLRKLIPDDDTRIAFLYFASIAVPVSGFLVLASTWGLWSGTSFLLRGAVIATCVAMPFICGYLFFFLLHLGCAFLVRCEYP